MERERYAIDAAMSRVTVRPFVSATSQAVGQAPALTLRDFVGEACFAPGTLEEASVLVTLNAASIGFDDDARDKDLRLIGHAMQSAVLETRKFPEIVFRSSNISASKAGGGQYWINLVGDLSLHGATRSEPVAAQVVFAGETLFARGELTLNPSLYRIPRVEIPGGALKLKDEVKCVFDIVARKRHDAAQKSKKRMLAIEGS
ncbi:MAG: YceI family protein [Acidobacteriaceae bacterium]|nr:YceI family protein [Acidobacteriaceae bacterium]